MVGPPSEAFGDLTKIGQASAHQDVNETVCRVTETVAPENSFRTASAALEAAFAPENGPKIVCTGTILRGKPYGPELSFS
jgi:hypothetical protein